MTWTKLSDTFHDDPAVLDLSLSARWTHVEALGYCNRHLLDGVVRQTRLRRIVTAEDPEADIAELVAAGLWEVDEDGWQIDWRDQEKAADVLARQQLARERQRRRRRHLDGDHQGCDPRYCNASGAVTRDTTRDDTRDQHRESRHPDPTRPDPTRPEGKGSGSGTGRPGAGAPICGPKGEDNPADSPAVQRHPFEPIDAELDECASCGLPERNARHGSRDEAA